MYAPVAKDWRELSKAANQERDPKKFMELIDQLNQALEQEDERRKVSTFARKKDE
jgi:hypothetical protein